MGGTNCNGKNRNQKPAISYAQKKRDKMDYRAAYFAHNPGLFGCVWKCAYCNSPIIGKHNVEVDHIIPLNSPLGKNARYNLVASCRHCNRQKSDSFDGRVVKGYLSKVFEIIVFSVQKLFLIALVGVWAGAAWLLRFLSGVLKKPFEYTSLTTKLVFAVIYAVVIYLLVRQFL